MDRGYSSYSISTSALDAVSGQRHVPVALYPGKGPPVPTVQKAGLAPEPVWTQVRGEILWPLPGIEPQSAGLLARSQTLYWLSYPAHRATRALPITYLQAYDHHTRNTLRSFEHSVRTGEQNFLSVLESEEAASGRRQVESVSICGAAVRMQDKPAVLLKVPSDIDCASWKDYF
jgi:hypothetical protein